jgi:hypothetical protein
MFPRVVRRHLEWFYHQSEKDYRFRKYSRLLFDKLLI